MLKYSDVPNKEKYFNNATNLPKRYKNKISSGYEIYMVDRVKIPFTPMSNPLGDYCAITDKGLLFFGNGLANLSTYEQLSVDRDKYSKERIGINLRGTVQFKVVINKQHMDESKSVEKTLEVSEDFAKIIDAAITIWGEYGKDGKKFRRKMKAWSSGKKTLDEIMNGTEEENKIEDLVDEGKKARQYGILGIEDKVAEVKGKKEKEEKEKPESSAQKSGLPELEFPKAVERRSIERYSGRRNNREMGKKANSSYELPELEFPKAAKKQSTRGKRAQDFRKLQQVEIDPKSFNAVLSHVNGKKSVEKRGLEPSE